MSYLKPSKSLELLFAIGLTTTIGTISIDNLHAEEITADFSSHGDLI